MEKVEREKLEVVEAATRFAVAAATFMEERGITQQAVANKIGRSQGYISHRLTGERYLDTQVLYGIAELAGLTLPALMIELSSRATASR